MLVFPALDCGLRFGQADWQLRYMSTTRPVPTSYLCGTADDITRNHVPPQILFPPPRPNDLITVACCRKCNEELSLTPGS